MIRLTMLMAATAASPKPPAATFRQMVARLASPCRASEGTPPRKISLAVSAFRQKRRGLMGILPARLVMNRSTAKLTACPMAVAIAAPATCMSSTKIKTGSRMILRMVPAVMPIMP